MKSSTLTQEELLNTVAGGEKCKLDNTEIQIDYIQMKSSRIKDIYVFFFVISAFPKTILIASVSIFLLQFIR